MRPQEAAAARPGFIPALGLHALTPLYDPLLRRVMREDHIKRALIRSAEIQSERVLDVGCGTGTLTILAVRASPESEVAGLDPDRAVLRRARAKAAAERVRLAFHQGSAVRLPYGDASFGIVLASLMLHHLPSGDRLEALREIRRVLRGDGRLFIVDFGPPTSLWTRLVTPVMARLEHTAPFFAGELPAILSRAGFTSFQVIDRVATVFGTVVSLRVLQAV